MNSLRTALLLTLMVIVATPGLAGIVQNEYSVPEPDEVQQGSYRTWYVPISGAPAGGIITKVEAQFDYTAWGVVQNYVSVRFNRGSDPGSSGGALLVSQGSLPAGNPGTTSWMTMHNWDGNSVNTNYYFRFMLASGSPYTCTIHGIRVRVTYAVAPNLYEPSDHDIFNRYSTSTIYFDWSSVSGASQYHINVFPSGNAGNPVVYDYPSSSNWTESSSSFPNGIYVYNVRALVDGAWSNPSDAREFIVDVPPAPPPLISPANGVNIDLGTPTTFQWGDSPDSPISRHYFRLVRGTDLNANPILENDLTGHIQNITLSGPTYSPGVYTWGVRAIKETPSGYNGVQYETTVGWGSYNTRTFTIVDGLPDPPSLVFPFNRSIFNRYTTPEISFGWVQNPEDIEFWLNVFPEGQSHAPKYDGVVTGSVFDLPVDATWEPGIYIWHMKVRTAAGWSEFCNTKEFIVDIPPPAPTLTAPPDGTEFNIDDTGTFTWNPPPVVTVARYYFRLVPGTDLNPDPVYDVEPASSGLTVTFDDATYNAGTHTWGVRAIKVTPPGYNQTTYEQNIGWGSYATRNFEIPAEGFDLISPAPGSNVSTAEIVFSWQDAGAVSYNLTVDDDPDFSSPEISSINPDFSFTTQTGITIPGNVLVDDTWYWFVTAVMGDGSEIESDSALFFYHPPTYAEPDWRPVYRLYHADDLDHFYCTSEGHRESAMAAGYNPEGFEGNLSYWPFNDPDMVPIYRFLRENSGDWHFYVAGDAERDIALQDPDNRYEGITGYGFDAPRQGLVPLYKLRHPVSNDHFYTISDFEKENAVNAFQFTFEGILTYVSPNGNLGAMAWSPLTRMAGLGASPDNGNFKHHQSTDFDIPGIGLPLRFSHQYNSRAVYYPDQLKSMGPGWSHDYSSCVTESEGLLFVYWASGASHIYIPDGFGGYDCLVNGVYDKLTFESSNQIRISKKNQVSYLFERPTTSYPFMLKEIRDRNDNTVTCQYEPGGMRRLDRVTGPAGRTLEFEYFITPALASRIRTVSDPADRVISFEYDTDSGTLDLTDYFDPEGKHTQYGYESSKPQEHQLITIQLPDGTIIDNTYDERKLNTQHWSGTGGGMTLTISGNTADIDYDNAGPSYTMTFDPPDNEYQAPRPKSMIQDSGTTTVNYDHADHPTLPSSMTDPRGYSHFFFYDSMGNLKEESHPLGMNIQYDYDAFNNVTRVTAPQSQITNYGYDGNGNLTSVTKPEGGVTSFNRNNFGQVTHMTNYAGTSTFDYDGWGNLTKVTDPLLHHVDFDVDNVGRVNQVQDANGKATNYLVDNRGLVTKVTDPLGGIMTLGYNDNGEMTSAHGPGSVSSSWVYSGGFLTSYQTPSTTTTYSYNSDGTLASRVRSLGSTTYSYDTSGRLDGVTGAHLASFSRDAAGNILTVSDGLFGLSFTYDALNHVKTTTDHWSNVVEFDYDYVGNTERISYGQSKGVDYTYDDDNRLLTVTTYGIGSSPLTVNYSYRPDGLVDRMEYSNDTWTTYGYDAASRLTHLTHSSNQGVIASYVYSMDPVGNHTGIVATEPLGSPELITDMATYSYNGSSQMTSDGVTTYGYDGNGNLSSMSGDRNLSLTFDQENRLTSYGGDGNGQFLYDVFGNRRQAVRNGVTTRYILDPRGMGRVLIETDGSGNPLNYYIYGMGLAARVKADGTAHFYHGNNVGSVVAMTDIDGNITHKYSYDPFGQPVDEEEADFNAFTFVGQHGVMREDLGLYFMRARYYDSRVGRFLGEDPVWAPQLYAYADNNPIGLFDPDGNSSRFPSFRSYLIKAGAKVQGGLVKTGTSIANKVLSFADLFGKAESHDSATSPVFDQKNAAQARIQESDVGQVEDILLLKELTQDNPKKMFAGEQHEFWEGLTKGGFSFIMAYLGI